MSKDNWFSNFNEFETPMRHDGLDYHTPENYYQAMKSEDSNHRRMCACVSPSKAKSLGRGCRIRPDWESVKEAVMEEALRWKFQEGTKARQQLLNTGDEEIVEWNSWHDNIWGICQCSMLTGSPYGVRNCTGGKNLLGKLLMKLREEFRQGSSSN